MEEFTLRPYQVQDIKFMTANKRVLNCNEPGLGKTLETLVTTDKLGKGKVLVVSPKIAVGVWLQEAEKWLGWDGIVITGDYKPKVRKQMRIDFLASNSRFLACNIQMLKEVMEDIPEWESIIIDEIHLLGLLNEKTAAYKQAKKLICSNLFLLTGTPIRKGPQDLYAPLSLLDPKRFRAYWGFVNRYCIVDDGPFGKTIGGRPKEPLIFKEMTSKYLIRHLKKDVLKDLPEKQRECVPIEMNKMQAEAYKQIEEDMMLEVNDEVLLTSGVLAQTLRMRQLLVCPRILDIDTDGAAIEALTEYFIPEEFANGRSVVVATVFKTAVPFVKDAIKKMLPGTAIFEIHGDVKEPAASVALRFQNHPSIRKVLIYTIKSGASWTAHKASTGFFLGAEWSCIDNIQAEDRIHRLGQTEKVQIKYLLHNGTIDDTVRTKLNQKNMAANWILQPNEVLANIKKRKEKYALDNAHKK